MKVVTLIVKQNSFVQVLTLVTSLLFHCLEYYVTLWDGHGYSIYLVSVELTELSLSKYLCFTFNVLL